MHQETHFQLVIYLILAVACFCCTGQRQGVPCAGTHARTRLLVAVPPAVAPTNKSALAAARMEILKTKDLNGQFLLP